MKLIICNNVLVAINTCKFLSYGLISINHNLPEINVNFYYCMRYDYLVCTIVYFTGEFNLKIKAIPLFSRKSFNLTFVRHDKSCRLCIHYCQNEPPYFQWKIESLNEIKYDATVVNIKLHLQMDY